MRTLIYDKKRVKKERYSEAEFMEKEYGPLKNVDLDRLSELYRKKREISSLKEREIAAANEKEALELCAFSSNLAIIIILCPFCQRLI